MATRQIRPLRVEGNVAYVTLTKGFEAIIDAADVALVDNGNWYALVNRQTVYAARTVGRRVDKVGVLMHRVITSAPHGMDVDHINGNGLDNRRSNLRLATRSENMRNSRQSSANTSGFKGVGWSKRDNNWRASITIDGRQHYIGAFSTPEIAHAAYMEVAERLFGEFARST